MLNLADQEYLNTHRSAIKKLVRSYLKKNNLPMKNLKRSMLAIESGVKRRNGCLFWTNSTDKPTGYISGILTLDGTNCPVLVILQLHNFEKDAIRQLETFAKQSSVKKILFQTHRKRAVVKRWLGRDWTTGPTIFEKKV